MVYNCQNADQKADKCPAYPPQKPGQDEIWNIRPFIPPIQSQQITEPTHLHLIKQDRDLFTSPNITLTLNRGMQTAYKYSDTGAIKGFFDMITAPIRSLFPQQTSAGVIHKTTIQIQGGKPTGVTNETDTTN